MVQILTPRDRESFGSIIGKGLGHGISSGAEMGTKMKLSDMQSEKDLERQIKLAQMKGEQSMNLQNLKNEQKQQQTSKDSENEGRDYNTIKDTFGEKFANVWKSAPVGGKTELLKQALETTLRGDNIDNLLKNVSNESNQFKNPEEQSPEQKVPQLQNGKVSKDFQWPDYSKRPLGYTPKDWITEKSNWRKENAPVFQENKNKLKSNINDSLAIKKLKKLNKSRKLPEDMERYLINPETGELYGLAQISGMASPETQEWLKETARFQNRAKDSFGSRVTNFDLVSYMKQFPTLMNTPEGRDRILKMMDINNQLDQSYEKALNQVYMKYGLSGIPQEKAEELAQSMISDETERLHNEYLGLDEQNKEDENRQNETGRLIRVVGPDGNEYEMDSSRLDELPEGYKII